MNIVIKMECCENKHKQLKYTYDSCSGQDDSLLLTILLGTVTYSPVDQLIKTDGLQCTAMSHTTRLTSIHSTSNCERISIHQTTTDYLRTVQPDCKTAVTPVIIPSMDDPGIGGGGDPSSLPLLSICCPPFPAMKWPP